MVADRARPEARQRVQLARSWTGWAFGKGHGVRDGVRSHRSPIGAPASMMTSGRLRTCSDYVREAKKDVATTARGLPCRPSAPREFDSHLTVPVGRPVNPGFRLDWKRTHHRNCHRISIIHAFFPFLIAIDDEIRSVFRSGVLLSSFGGYLCIMLVII